MSKVLGIDLGTTTVVVTKRQAVIIQMPRVPVRHRLWLRYELAALIGTLASAPSCDESDSMVFSIKRLIRRKYGSAAMRRLGSYEIVRREWHARELATSFPREFPRDPANSS